ncbi:MAG: LamG domain-containing protein [Verrucomicrobia bacterium]|nr:LamG domain-containing protein [Verrucomicrobiota bacterium]
MQQGVGSEFAYLHSVASVLRPELYAIKETFNLNDYLVHWLEEGEAALRWPKLFGRYRLVWPADLAKYSHYVRPPAATDAEAAQTAVLMDPENAPTIEYQDALDRPRARFTPELKFYTWLNASYPVHRTLLRYVSGENIGFERVLSTLNTALIDAVRLPDASIDEPVGLRQAGANSVLTLGGASGSYGRMPAGTYFAPGGFTIEAWVFVREVRNWSRLIDFGNGPASDNVLLALSQGTSGRPRLEFYRGASTTGLTANSVLPLGQWVHLAATFDGTTARFYLNGQLDAEGPLQGATQVVTRNNAYVGRSNWGGDAWANADFDNLRIWSRGLSAAEILGSMRTEYPAGTSGLLAQFTFERLENPATDSSGRGAHLTLFGGAATGAPGLNRLTAPRYIARTVPVGERIQAPAGERGDTGGADYLAGYIVKSKGTSYNPGAYRDPFRGRFRRGQSGGHHPRQRIAGQEPARGLVVPPEPISRRPERRQHGPGIQHGLLAVGGRRVHDHLAGQRPRDRPCQQTGRPGLEHLGGTGNDLRPERPGPARVQPERGARDHVWRHPVCHPRRSEHRGARGSVLVASVRVGRLSAPGRTTGDGSLPGAA